MKESRSPPKYSWNAKLCILNGPVLKEFGISQKKIVTTAALQTYSLLRTAKIGKLRDLTSLTEWPKFTVLRPVLYLGLRKGFRREGEQRRLIGQLGDWLND